VWRLLSQTLRQKKTPQGLWHYGVNLELNLFTNSVYHSLMRHFVLALMIALLPLRGWVGDAMAMEMASSTINLSASVMASGTGSATGTLAAADSDTENSVYIECSGHAGSQDSDPNAAPQCKVCSDCQICHTVALTAVLEPLAPAPQSAGRLPVATPFFASAERAPGFKPPIS